MTFRTKKEMNASPPQHWKKMKVGEMCEVVKESFDPQEGETVPYVGLANIGEGTLRIESAEDTGEVMSRTFRFKPGHILFGKLRPYFRKVAMPDFEGVCSTDILVIEPKEGIDGKFLFYFLANPEFIDKATASSTGTRMPRADWKYLSKLEYAIPSLQEQKDIGNLLHALHARINLNLRMNQTLEAIGKALFKRWFINFEFPNEDGEPYKSSGGEMVETELGEVPKGWAIKSLSEVGTFLNGKAMQHYPAKEGEQSLPVIKIRELRDGITDSTDKASAADTPEEYVIHDGDLVFSWSGSLLVRIWTGGPGALNQHLFKVTSDDYPLWFMEQWINYHLEKFQRIARDKATTMGHIKRGHLDESMVLVPSKKHLQFFDKMMQPLWEKRIICELQNRTISTSRDTLLPKLITGDIRIPIEDTEVVEISEPEPEMEEEQFTKFQEAVLISEVVKACSSPKVPLGRFRRTKFSYFAERYMGRDTTQSYAQMEAGPYKPSIRYKGPEGIALGNGYCKRVEKGKYLPGPKADDFRKYAKRYHFIQPVTKVKEELRFKTDNDLELLSTVDYSILVLNKRGEKPTPEKIIEYIDSVPKWKNKLKKPYFSKEKIKEALSELQRLFPEEYSQVVVS